MDYLILNEESLPFATREHCDASLPVFFQILNSAFDNRITAVRVSDAFEKGWYALMMADQYSLRHWIENQEQEYNRKIKILISKTETPHIPFDNIHTAEVMSLSDFYLEIDRSINTPSLGAAFLIQQPGFSFLSADHWNHEKIDLIHETIDEQLVLKSKTCKVQNIATVPHWDIWLKELERQRKENCRNGATLWANRHLEFPHLIFCGSTDKQIQNLSVNNATFSRLWDNLRLLNNGIQSSSSDQSLAQVTGLTIHDESDSVKNNPRLRKHRMFTLPEGSRAFFGPHITNFPAAFRLHVLPDYNEKIIYIGYFGKHLPTQKF